MKGTHISKRSSRNLTRQVLDKIPADLLPAPVQGCALPPVALVQRTPSIGKTPAQIRLYHKVRCELEGPGIKKNPVTKEQIAFAICAMAMGAWMNRIRHAEIARQKRIARQAEELRIAMLKAQGIDPHKFDAKPKATNGKGKNTRHYDRRRDNRQPARMGA